MAVSGSKASDQGGHAPGTGSGVGSGGSGRTGATGTTKSQTSRGYSGISSTPFGSAAQQVGGSGGQQTTVRAPAPAAVPPAIASQVKQGVPLAQQPPAVQKWFEVNKTNLAGGYNRPRSTVAPSVGVPPGGPGRGPNMRGTPPAPSSHGGYAPGRGPNYR